MHAPAGATQDCIHALLANKGQKQAFCSGVRVTGPSSGRVRADSRVSGSHVGETFRPAIPRHSAQASEGESAWAVTEVVVAAARRRIRAVKAVVVEKYIFVCMLCVWVQWS